MTGNTWKVTSAIGVAMALVFVIAARPMAQSASPKPAAQAKPAATKLPAAVDAAFKKAYPQATIKNVAHETEDGQEQYEIESMNGGLRLDVTCKPDGTVIAVEEEIAAADVPAAVMTAIAARYPKATITLRERVTAKGATSYEISLKGAPVASVELTPDGKWISPKMGK